ncbi:MAG: molybdopterin-dependent oxidoreductase, partial [Rhodospirillales bacterium]|nr:molybdopterin-dependent oxidoreductase [Rhodospirillales bacterium]
MSGLTIHDRPNSYIGRSVPRPNIRRLVDGKGRFTDDISLPRMLFAAFLRSPYAHAEMVTIDTSAAEAAPGVVLVVTGNEMADVCSPWVGVLTHLEGLKSQPQYALPIEKATWQGEAVVAVVAETRAQAEDAVELVQVEWNELPVVADMETALEAATQVIHADLGDNLAWQREFETDGIDAIFEAADQVVEETFHFGRHTGVTLEARSIVSNYDASEEQLTVYLATQTPHMMQTLFAKH